jgi:hypothetical protein
VYEYHLLWALCICNLLIVKTILEQKNAKKDINILSATLLQ